MRRLHRWLGIALALPFLGWAATGLVFFLKPGYGAAYAELPLATRPLAGPRVVAPGADWREVRWLSTALGEHLLVRTGSGWRQIDAATGSARPEPSEAELRTLLRDAIAADPRRYGELVGRGSGGTWRTTTGVELELDWATLRLAQRGRDTRALDLLYRIHYLQWTGHAPIDRGLGLAGLAGVALVALLGLRLAFGRESSSAPRG